MLSLSSDAQPQDKYCDDFFSESDQVTSDNWGSDSQEDDTESQVQPRRWSGRWSEDLAVQTSPGHQLPHLRSPLQRLRVPPADNYQASWLYWNILPRHRHLIGLGEKGTRCLI